MAKDKKDFREIFGSLRDVFDKMSNVVTNEDFTNNFKGVLDQAKSIKDQNAKDLKRMGETLVRLFEDFKSSSKRDFDAHKRDVIRIVNSIVTRTTEDFDRRIDDFNAKIAQVKDGRDGRDADERRVFEMIKENLRISDLKGADEELGVAARDALEMLGDDDRLNIKNVKGLKKILKAFAEELYQDRLRFVGGTPRPTFIDSETPSGTVNGTNKAFALALTPSPATTLKVYVNGQRMTLTEDYTFSGSTITFVTAPPTGSIVRCDYHA